MVIFHGRTRKKSPTKQTKVYLPKKFEYNQSNFQTNSTNKKNRQKTLGGSDSGPTQNTQFPLFWVQHLALARCWRAFFQVNRNRFFIKKTTEEKTAKIHLDASFFQIAKINEQFFCPTDGFLGCFFCLTKHHALSSSWFLWSVSDLEELEVAPNKIDTSCVERKDTLKINP